MKENIYFLMKKFCLVNDVLIYKHTIRECFQTLLKSHNNTQSDEEYMFFYISF